MSCIEGRAQRQHGGLQKGFTLVEVQIALLLLALLTVVMVGALRTASQTWTRVSAHQDVAERRLHIQQFLRSQLSEIQFRQVRMVDDRVISTFLGSANALHFVAPFPRFEHDGQLYWWSLLPLYNEETETHQLVLEHRPFHFEDRVEIDDDGQLLLIPSDLEEIDEEPREAVEPTTIILAENFIIKSMEFVARDRFGEEFDWEDWEPSEMRPLVIRLTIAEVHESGEEILLPELAVAPRQADQRRFGAVYGPS